MGNLDSLGADEVPSEDLVIVSDADDVIRAGPAHAGDQLRVLGLLDVRGLEPHPPGPGPVSVMSMCHGVISCHRSQNVNNNPPESRHWNAGRHRHCTALPSPGLWTVKLKRGQNQTIGLVLCPNLVPNH